MKTGLLLVFLLASQSWADCPENFKEWCQGSYKGTLGDIMDILVSSVPESAGHQVIIPCP